MASPKAGHPGSEVRKLRGEASEAVRKGQLRKALARYQALEVLEPADAQWCHRVADVHARLGEKDEEIAALVRTVERLAAGGFLLRGIAVCRRILDLDPRHVAAQERLSSLHATATAAPPRVPQLARLPDRGPPLGPDALSEIVLDEVASEGEGERAGVRALALGPEPEAATLAGRVLPHVPLFGQLGPASLARVVSRARLIRLREERVLFREGDLGDALFVVVEGAVVPSAERPERRRLAVLQEGEFFGEIALVTEQPRIATVRALVDTTLLLLEADAVRTLIRDEPGLLVVFLRFLRERLLHRLAQTSPLFRPLGPAALRHVASRFQFLQVEDGAELTSQGGQRRRLFVALCGRFEVTLHDGTQLRSLALLEPGDVFGEMCLLSGEPAMASVTARGRGFVLALEADAFHGLAVAHPALLEGLRNLASEREARNEESASALSGAGCRRMDLP